MSESTIVMGDARDLLPTVNRAEVSLVLTDPPYNIGFRGYDVWHDALPDDEYIEMLCALQEYRKVVVIQYPEEMMRLVVPALGPPNHVSAWCYNSNIPRRFRLINYYGVVPDYSRLYQPYKNQQDKRVRELLGAGSPGANLYEWWDDIQLVKNVSTEKGDHPCPVPERLMERIILLTTDPGDTVLDPFVGEGTTAVAAKKTGRNFIGFDISPAYVEAARKRVATTQPPLFPADVTRYFQAVD